MDVEVHVREEDVNGKEWGWTDKSRRPKMWRKITKRRKRVNHT